MKNQSLFLYIFVLSITLNACSDQSVSLDENPTSDYAFNLVENEGMTCHTMGVLLKLKPEETEQLTQKVRDQFEPKDLALMIDSRETGCTDSSEGEIGLNLAGTRTQAITGTYSVELVEEASGSTGNSGAIYVDSLSSDWMCNSGLKENPADYIGQYNVSGAYANRAALRIRGTNVWSTCYIQASNSTRVYSDDDMRVCIGYWHVFFCGAVAPLAGETRVWR